MKTELHLPEQMLFWYLYINLVIPFNIYGDPVAIHHRRITGQDKLRIRQLAIWEPERVEQGRDTDRDKWLPLS